MLEQEHFKSFRSLIQKLTVCQKYVTKIVYVNVEFAVNAKSEKVSSTVSKKMP